MKSEEELTIEGEPALPLSLLESPSFLLSKVGMEAKRRTCDNIALMGLRIGHHAVLACIVELGPATQRELADRLRFDASDVVSLLDDLEDRGWIERIKDQQDRRRNVITPTKAGRAGLKQLQRDSRQASEELLEVLSDDEQQQLVQMLRRVFSSYDPRG